jgi:polysaccharide deacetylase 2 family uncharacterized protein YibQ
MDKRKTTLIYGLLGLLIIEMCIWGMFNYGKEYSTDKDISISSLVEETLNKALLKVGITETNIVKKYWEEKGAKEKDKWIEVHEEFVVKPSVSLNEVLRTIDKNVTQAGGKIFSYNFLEGGKKLKISLGRGNRATHSLFISKEQLPLISIVIDDMGYGREIEKEILKIPYPLTISVIPQLKDSSRIAKLAYNSGFEVLLHQPLESKNPDYNKMLGLITADMNKAEIKHTIMKNLETVPYAVGANNHEGSKAMEEEETVAVILNYLKEKNLFFLDSLTTPYSCTRKVAKNKDIPYLVRNTFLDNKKEEKYIEEQLWELVSQSSSNGQAIGIAHPSPETLNALKDTLPKIEAEGVQIVPVSQLLEK